MEVNEISEQIYIQESRSVAKAKQDIQYLNKKPNHASLKGKCMMDLLVSIWRKGY